MIGISIVQNRKTVWGGREGQGLVKLYTPTGEKYLEAAIKDSFSELLYHSLIVIHKGITIFTNFNL